MRRPKFLHKMWNVSFSLINQSTNQCDFQCCKHSEIKSCRVHLKSHGGGSALGQAGELSRLDRWRSWVNGIKGFEVVHGVVTIYGWPLIETSPSLHWQLSNFSSIPHLICSPLDHLLKHLLQVCFGSSCQHLPTQWIKIFLASALDLLKIYRLSKLPLICSALDHLLRRFF